MKVYKLLLHMGLTEQSVRMWWTFKTPIHFAILATGDMVALEAKYHKSCLTAFYSRARTAGSSISSNDDLNAELVAYMEEFHNELSIALAFKLIGLAQLYKRCLEQFGGNDSGHIHTCSGCFLCYQISKQQCKVNMLHLKMMLAVLSRKPVIMMMTAIPMLCILCEQQGL